MEAVIVAFAKRELSAKIKRMLEAGGIPVFAVCQSRAEVMRQVSDLEEGVVVTSFRLPDATAESMYEDLPHTFSLLVIASAREQDVMRSDGIVVLPLPVNYVELSASVNLLLRPSHQRTQTRGKEEKKLMDKAKAILMERYRMTESEAHRFIQKRSMDTGARMADTARRIIG
jgi:hypothetical protein